tara:strand:- start:2249 stop:2941 length:693 start_codon:yes stop_codon:yes gene_type:complete
MKILIISAGPGLSEINQVYGHATDWIANLIPSDVEVDIVNIYNNDDFDESLYDAWIVTGSAFSVIDNTNWIINLKNKIKYAYKHSIYVLGICFGHQIISSSLGGNIIKNPKGWELGSYKLNLNDKGVSSFLFNNIDADDYFYFSHEDVVSQLPLNAIELANNNMGLQAFSINNKIFGVQFHPEFTFNIMEQYVNIRFKKGLIPQLNPVIESKTSNKIISNFIEICKRKIS